MNDLIAVVGGIAVAAVLFWATDRWDEHRARRAAQDPAACARIRAGIVDWYSRYPKDACARDLPLAARRTGTGDLTPPVPSSSTPDLPVSTASRHGASGTSHDHSSGPVRPALRRPHPGSH